MSIRVPLDLVNSLAVTYVPLQYGNELWLVHYPDDGLPYMEAVGVLEDDEMYAKVLTVDQKVIDAPKYLLRTWWDTPLGISIADQGLGAHGASQ